MKQVEMTLNIDFPGHDIDSAIAEAGNRMQVSWERQLRIFEDIRRLQSELDHAEQDFERARAAAELFEKATAEEIILK